MGGAPTKFSQISDLIDTDSKFFPFRGIQIHYKDFPSKKSNSTTIVLHHGFTANIESFRVVIPLLTEHFRVIAYDRPAFGLTERPLPKSVTCWNFTLL
jgi:pimeloyl-ACP methyl ester carboxylesterase